MIELLPLQGRPADVAAATQLRTPELLARLHADLEQALAADWVAADKRALLPEALAVLPTIVDAQWWLDLRRWLPPFASLAAYEDYPWPIWSALERETRRRREQAAELAAAAITAIGELAVEPCPRAEHAALEPTIPAELDAALRTAKHWKFLVAEHGPTPRIVAVHRGGVRFVGAKGKPTARAAPKGSGQVEAAVIADDGSFVVLRNAGGLHRVEIPSKALTSFRAPPRTDYALASLAGGRLAMIVVDEDTVGVGVFGFDEAGDLIRQYVAVDPRLERLARIDRVALASGGDLLLVRTRRDGQERTLLGHEHEGTLRWLGEHPQPLFAPRRAPDGSIVALAGRDAAVRLRPR